MASKLIRFDWAIKKLLRHKANFKILEGFLTELLKFEVTIDSILKSEGNKETSHDKFNRVDIMIKSTSGERMIVEVQNDSQVDYFQRMLYGTSKLIEKGKQQGMQQGQQEVILKMKQKGLSVEQIALETTNIENILASGPNK